MKANYIFGFLFIFSGKIIAQVDPVGQFNKHIVENWKGEYVRVSQYRVKGSPYLLGESFPGSIKFSGMQNYEKGNILYNLYDQKVGFDVNKQVLEMDVAVEDFTITLPGKFGGGTYLFKNGKTFGDSTSKNYYNVLEDGTKVSFLKVYKIKLGPDPSNLMDKDLKLFEQYFEYYLYVKSNRSLNKIKLKEREIFKQLGEEAYLKSIITNSGINVSKEDGMLQLIRAYNKK